MIFPGLQTHKTSVHLRNRDEDIFNILTAFLSIHWETTKPTFLYIKKGKKRLMTWIHVIQVVWRDTIALYDEQISFRL